MFSKVLFEFEFDFSKILECSGMFSKIREFQVVDSTENDLEKRGITFQAY